MMVLQRVWNVALNLLLPPRCAGCGGLGSTWCAECDASIRDLPEPTCERCGLPKPEQTDCRACAASSYSFTAARSRAIYAGPLRRALLHLKRHRNEELVKAFTEHLVGTLAETTWKPDLVIPIPLAHIRQQDRGFNQAALLAKPLAAKLGIGYEEQCLTRGRETGPQFHLPRLDRWANVEHVFTATPTVRGLRVLLVDDIMTTGATLSSAARELVGQDAAAVYGLTMARAIFESSGDFG
jgi:ComF family protein